MGFCSASAFVYSNSTKCDSPARRDQRRIKRLLDAMVSPEVFDQSWLKLECSSLDRTENPSDVSSSSSLDARPASSSA